VKRLTPRFLDACGDPRRWGPAKALAYRMRDDGIELEDHEAIGEWLEPYNASPERSPVLGTGRASAEKRGRRKAARQARKRNRR